MKWSHMSRERKRLTLISLAVLAFVGAAVIATFSFFVAALIYAPWVIKIIVLPFMVSLVLVVASFFYSY